MDFASQGKDGDGNDVNFYIPDDAAPAQNGDIEERCDITIAADSGLKNVDLGTLSTDNDDDYFVDQDGKTITEANIGGDGTITVTLVTKRSNIQSNTGIFNVYID
jgi:hypothetical protein